jgi:dihydrofolate synthase/folylpolyglutamate synthase
VITPKVSVITALYLEHTNILGDTLAEIAFEKAGIIKTGVPVVLSPQKEEALQKVAEIAKLRQAPLILAAEQYHYHSQNTSLDGQSFTITSVEPPQSTTLEIRLLGQYQLENATTAYAALQVLRAQGMELLDADIKDGFSSAKWPARFEILNINPTIVVDSAHNPDSARMIRQAIEEYFPGQPLVIILGVSEDKNISGIIEELLPHTVHIICTQSTHPRAMDAHELLNIVTPYGCPVKVCVPVHDALLEAGTIAGNDALILVTGSIFVAATARIDWFESQNIPWSKDVGLQLASQ